MDFSSPNTNSLGEPIGGLVGLVAQVLEGRNFGLGGSGGGSREFTLSFNEKFLSLILKSITSGLLTGDVFCTDRCETSDNRGAGVGLVLLSSVMLLLTNC